MTRMIFFFFFKLIFQCQAKSNHQQRVYLFFLFTTIYYSVRIILFWHTHGQLLAFSSTVLSQVIQGKSTMLYLRFGIYIIFMRIYKNIVMFVRGVLNISRIMKFEKNSRRILNRLTHLISYTRLMSYSTICRF